MQEQLPASCNTTTQTVPGAERLHASAKTGACFLFFLLTACSAAEKAAINELLDARDAAISAKDVAAYSRTIDGNYRDKGENKAQTVARMIRLFDRFEALEMKSFDRNIQLVSNDEAICLQSYRLRARLNGQWRQFVARERLRLRKKDGRWVISGGL